MICEICDHDITDGQWRMPSVGGDGHVHTACLNAANLVEDVEDLRRLGVPAEAWPQRLGKSPEAALTALRRAGRPDLAKPLNRFAQAQRRARRHDKPCPECGGPVSGDPRHTWCSVSCWANSTAGRRQLAANGRKRAASRNVWETA